MEQQKIVESNQSCEQQWIDTCNKQGWDDSSQIIHLEGFLRDKGIFSEFSVYAAKAAAEENADASGEDLMDFDAVIDAIKETLLGVDGEFLAQTHNFLCSDSVSYEGDSTFKQSVDGEVVSFVSFALVIENITEVLIGANGTDLAKTYNRICSGEIEYLGDSIFKQFPVVMTIDCEPGAGKTIRVTMEGEPGTGKTMAARAVGSSEISGHFIPVIGSEFGSTFVGSGSAVLKGLFADARKEEK